MGRVRRTTARLAGAVAVGGALLAGPAACGSDAVPVPGDQPESPVTVPPSTDAEQLRSIFTVPGEPEVWWIQEIQGDLGDTSDDRVPGPTDYLTTAVLRYDDPAAVTELVAGFEPVSGSEPALDWFPDEVRLAAEDDSLSVDRYPGVTAFGPGVREVAVVRAAPSYVIVFSATT